MVYQSFCPDTRIQVMIGTGTRELVCDKCGSGFTPYGGCKAKKMQATVTHIYIA